MLCYNSIQLGMCTQRILKWSNPVPTENQRIVKEFNHEKIKFQANPTYGRFKAPSLKWAGHKSVSGTKLAMERDQIIAKNKKRTRDDESANQSEVNQHVPASTNLL